MERAQRGLNKETLANKGFNDILTDGLYLFRKNYGKLILPFIVFSIISSLLIVFLTTDLDWIYFNFSKQVDEIIENFIANPELATEAEMMILVQDFFFLMGIIFFQGAIGAIFTTLSMCSVSTILYEQYTLGNSESKKSFDKRIFIVLLIVGLAVPAGTYLLFFIPGIIIFSYYIFLIYTHKMDDIEKPAKEARLIAKGYSSKIIGVFIIAVVITTLIDTLYQELLLRPTFYVTPSTYKSWLNPSTRNYLMLFGYRLVLDIINIALAPLFICFLTILFACLKARKDLGYPSRSSSTRYSYQNRDTQTLEPSIQNEPYTKEDTLEDSERIYCPFCGENCEKPKRFCPGCGKSLKNLI